MIRRLRLHRFRNHAETVLEPDPGLNLIVGANAQGKTNLLEAIATLALSRSPRTSQTTELLAWGSDQCAVDAAIARWPVPIKLSIRFERHGDGRVVRQTLVDDTPRPARSLLGLCPVVLFWADDLELVTAGPHARRRLLDTLLAQIDPLAALQMTRYRRVISQRNALLHQLRDARGPSAALASFTESLVELGADIRSARITMVHHLAGPTATASSRISDQVDRLTISYLAGDTELEPPADVPTLRADLTADLRRRAGDELRRGVTLAGPHRDDLSIRLAGRPAQTASHGQHRSIALALKLAEVDLVTSRLGVTPVLLMDDVLGELDLTRRSLLLEALAQLPGSSQILATATDASAFDSPRLAPRRLFSVSAGRVS